MQVTAKRDKKEYTIEYDFGADLADAAKRFTDAVVFSNYVAGAKVKLQALVGAWGKAGKDISQLSSTWKPGMQMQRATPDAGATVKALFAKMSKEEKAEFLKELKGL